MIFTLNYNENFEQNPNILHHLWLCAHDVYCDVMKPGEPLTYISSVELNKAVEYQYGSRLVINDFTVVPYLVVKKNLMLSTISPRYDV